MVTFRYTPGRYEAREDNPCYVYDLKDEKRTSTHLDFEGAVNRAYILNNFSTGVNA